MRRAGVVMAVVAAVVVLSPAGAIAGVHVTHPRDEAGYLDYLTKYGSGADDVLVTLPPTETLLDEGDHACAWLADQPWALLRTSDDFRFPATLTSYLASGAGPTRGGLPDRQTIAVAAWEYLCPATRYLQKPHYVFTQAGGD